MRGSPVYSMELKDFIKATIRDISEAVTELNEEMSGTGLLVNPVPDAAPADTMYAPDNRIIQQIDFNVSVTTSDRTEKGGGLKVYVASADLNNLTGHEATSTISFHIKVALPASSG